VNNFHTLLTPKEAFEKDVIKGTTLPEYEVLSRMKGMCIVCRKDEIWKLANTEMCFSCTTGESDASEDYELKEG
jgi:hypothetical protein